MWERFIPVFHNLIASITMHQRRIVAGAGLLIFILSVTYLAGTSWTKSNHPESSDSGEDSTHRVDEPRIVSDNAVEAGATMGESPIGKGSPSERKNAAGSAPESWQRQLARSGALLEPVAPDPSDVATTVRFAVAHTQPVVVGLYNGEGRLVQSLYDDVSKPGDLRKVRIDHMGLPAGVYFVRMHVAGKIMSRPVVVR